eukprot:CAMPEP_0170566262 /NCGR_PEP_ID=MMETSP0211-20121228/79712_1 /TAXON_ID=311385 /ORGANISM="Pseudokeronopsis sp., Strain OXSARD2" /LENGTH=176 /DNA_ID=CAMNT_0010887369 /DNA_START=731 /DNA_END=1262 /DNA_ORIENTATION=-
MSVANGGIADLYIIVGTNPNEVVADFHNYIVGLPAMPPVYALGWNQCRWGYEDLNALEEVIQGYEENAIPLDNLWSDIDYMFNYRSFTVDQNRFPYLNNFVEDLHDKDMHFIPVISSGIAYRPWGNYSIFDDGVEQDIFIKAHSDSEDPSLVNSGQMRSPMWIGSKKKQWLGGRPN